MKYIDLFSGIGGFRHSLDSVGMECIFSSEIDGIPSEMYKLLHNEQSISGDITKIDEKEIPNHDLLVGGFPCQGFSTNGTRLGFEYKTGNLFFEALRIAKEKKPKFVLMENVTGLLNHDKRRTIAIMLKSLSDAGYSVDFHVLVSTDFGLPQKRERVFIIGIHDHIFEEWRNTDVKQVNETKNKVLEYYDDIKSFNFPYPKGNNQTVKFSDIAETKLENVDYIKFDDFLQHINDDTYRIKDGTTKGYTDFKAIPYHTTIDYTFMTSKTRRGRVKQGITKTLDQSVDIAVFDGKGFRRITPLEVFRLQGFPDEFYYTLKDAGFKESQLYKRPSRSVSIPIVKVLGEAIITYNELLK
jgi:DNA (cytosine-5)-methyltransferase 1